MVLIVRTAIALAFAQAATAAAFCAVAPERKDGAGETVAFVPGSGGMFDAARQIGALIASLQFAEGSTGTVRCAAAKAGPIRFSNVRAAIIVGNTPGDLRLEDVRADCMGGKVTCRVEIIAAPEGERKRRPAMKLAMNFENVELPLFPAFLEPLRLMSGGPQRWLASGCVRGGMNGGDSVAIGIAGRIEPSLGRADSQNPHGVEEITATVTLFPGFGSATVREFSFRILGARFRGKAEILASPWKPPRDAPGMTFETEFSGLEFGELMKAMRLTGMAADWTLAGKIEGRRAPGEEGFRADVSVEARGTGLDRPPPLSGIAARIVAPDMGGAVSIEEFSARAYGGEVWGRLKMGPFETRKPGAAAPGSSGTTVGTYDVGTGVAGTNNAGGMAVESGGAINATAMPFAADIHFMDLRISDILKDFGRGDLGCSGFLSGRIQGVRTELGGAPSGRIRATVKGGNLGRFPLAAAGSLESLVSSSRNCVENCELDCELGPDGIEIRRFELSSMGGDFFLCAEPGGKLDREWRFRNFYLRPEAPKGFVDRVPVVKQFAEIIGEARRRVTRIKVEGTLFAPKVSLAPFHGPWGPAKE